MTQERLSDLNTNTLIGMTDKRGHAWHYDASLQGAESNHYAGPIPVADVSRRLFNFELLAKPIFADLGGFESAQVASHKAIVNSATNEVLGIVGSKYRPHAYGEWLIKHVATILGDELVISSAGLLRHGAVAWVEVSRSDNIRTPEGVEFRPNVLAATSTDGTVASTYRATKTMVVCDNTLSIALRESRDRKYSVRHTAHSELNVLDARAALQVVDDGADEFSRALSELCAWEVSPRQWDDFLAELTASPTDSKRAATMSANKRDQLDQLYRHDVRAATWQGTALGVLQAVNTYSQHLATVRGEDRAERVKLNVIKGQAAGDDARVLGMLAKVTGREELVTA